MDQTRLSAYQQKALSALQAAEAIKDAGNWSLSTENGKVKLYTAPTNSGLDAIKLEMNTEVEPMVVWRHILDNWRDANDRLQPDLVEGHQVISLFPEDQTLWRQFLRSPVWGIAPRELLLFDYSFSTQHGLYVHLSTSVESEEIPVDGERIRGDLLYGVHFVTPGKDSGSVVTSVSLGDPKGSLPLFLVNWKVSERCEFYSSFLTELETRSPRHY